MADLHNRDPLTRADLDGLTQMVLRATTAHRDEYQTNLVQARAEIRGEAAHLSQLLGNEMAQLRHDLLTRLEAAARRLEAIVDQRDGRLVAVLLVSQLVVVLVLAAVQVLVG